MRRCGMRTAGGAGGGGGGGGGGSGLGAGASFFTAHARKTTDLGFMIWGLGFSFCL